MHWLLKIPLTLATIWAAWKLLQRTVRKQWQRARMDLEAFSLLMLALAGICYIVLFLLVGILAS